MKEGAEFSAPSKMYQSKISIRLPQQKGDGFARLDVPGFVAGDAIDIHNK